jgi:hypothetical protein
MTNNIRTNAQRMISAKSAAAADLKSSVKMLAEITRNIPETIETGEAAPMLYLLDYLSGEKAKSNAALAIIRAVTFGVSVKLDVETGRFIWKQQDKAGVNSHYETLNRFVSGGNAGLMNNTLHDAIRAQKMDKPKKEFDAVEYVSKAVSKLLESGMNDAQIVDAVKAALRAKDGKGKPVMDNAGAMVKLFKAA